MNEQKKQAFNTLVAAINKAVQKGTFDNISEAGIVFNALAILAADYQDAAPTSAITQEP